ncbi:Oxalate:formate antiporter [bacterium HR32]|nr:Oxalate:formate antiporter [bacterium HR32]
MKDRWRWVVLPFCALALTMGVRSGFGVYVLPWEAEYGASRTGIASVSSLSLLVYGLGNVLAGSAAERFGVGRVMAASLALVAVGLLASTAALDVGWLYLWYGVVASVGFAGASHVTASVAVRHRFPDRRRSFALSVVVAGMCAGQMAVVPAQVLGVAQWGWKPVLASLAGLAALLALAAAFGSKSDAEVSAGHRVQAGRASSVGALLRDVRFWVFLAPYAVCGFTDSGLVDNHFVPYARGLGVPEGALAASLSTLAAANLAGTVAAGYLADRWGRAAVLSVLYGVRGLALAALVAGGPQAVWAFAPLFGLTHFATIAPTNTLALSLFSGSAPALAVGLASFVHQVGAALGAVAGGAAFDRLGSYEAVFAVSVGLLAASAGGMGWLGRVAEPDFFGGGPVRGRPVRVGSEGR